VALREPEVKAKLIERYGARVPVHEPLVTRSAIFDSQLFETVVMRRTAAQEGDEADEAKLVGASQPIPGVGPAVWRAT
jgi:hypothetical protein